MKILSEIMPGAGFYILHGYKDAFENLGHQWFWWDRKQKSCFDIFSEVEPDMFFGMTYQMDRPLIKNIQQRPQMKVILKGGNFGDINKDIDVTIYPLVMSTPKEVETIKLLGDNVWVYNYYHKNKIEYSMGGWEKYGVHVIALPTAANVYNYFPTKIHPILLSDITFVGGTWEYKSQNLNKWIIPLTFPVGKFNIKVSGGGWAIPQSIGHIDIVEERELYSSSTVCPNIFEPHCSIFPEIGEINERCFKVPACRGFIISERIKTLEEDFFTDNEIVYADNPKDLEEKIHYYIKNPDERLPYIEKAYRIVLDKHTYDHRVKDIFNYTGIKNATLSA